MAQSTVGDVAGALEKCISSRVGSAHGQQQARDAEQPVGAPQLHGCPPDEGIERLRSRRVMLPPVKIVAERWPAKAAASTRIAARPAAPAGSMMRPSRSAAIAIARMISASETATTAS